MPVPSFPDPSEPAASPGEVFARYLDYFRERLIDKLEALPAADVRSSRLPSGWTPIELAKHLTFVERRWLAWGFEGVDVGDPWGDRAGDRWFVAPREQLADVLAELRVQGEATRRVIADHDLEEIGQPGPRWRDKTPPTLQRILMHLVQEYARHLGQLDIVAELAGGEPGE